MRKEQMIDTAKIAEVVNRMYLTRGIGDKKNACSFAAINLALRGELIEDCPDCASNVLWQWGIVTQDAMPDILRNSAAWKSQLPYVAGTGKSHEKERLALIVNHMWTVALPVVQPVADAQGFGDAWRAMWTEKTTEAAVWVPRNGGFNPVITVRSLWAAEAVELVIAAGEAIEDACAVAQAARAAARAVVESVAVVAAARPAAEPGRQREWNLMLWTETLDPCGLLAQLIAVGHEP